jgi:hypothetical protein
MSQLELTPEDFDAAEQMARKLGFTQTTRTSARWGLFCLCPRSQRGCIIKTQELGLTFVKEALGLAPSYFGPAGFN